MIRKQGFVALLDILGFSERVAQDAELGGIDRYISTVIDETQAYPDLRVILFSDTVLIYTLDDSPHAGQSIIEASSRLEHSLLAKEVPLRGAIAHGTFARSENDLNGTVVAGRPIIEAHYYEAQLQWVGIILAPSVLRQMPELPTRGIVHGPRGNEEIDNYIARTAQEARVQPCDRIPVELSPGTSTSYLEGFAVVPLGGNAQTPQDLKQCMSENLARLRWLKQLAPDPRSQAKYGNTIAWLQPLYQQWIMRLH
jgi:hypothetical protein